jgi:hypothetical protein
MLKYLHLKNVGPAPEMEMELADRLNLITGDNGLGKSFLLDVAWWALTRRWPQELNPNLTSGYAARPTDVKKPATIEFSLTGKSKEKLVSYTSTYAPRDQAWSGRAGRPWNPGLVIYAHADGGFSVWDPARNYWKKRGNIDVQERLPGYVFSQKEVWEGLRVGHTQVCKGLLDDWSIWIREDDRPAKNMAGVLRALSPGERADEQLKPGPLMRIDLDSAQDIPSLRTGYSDGVPILHASSGVRRIVALAYMLLWTWQEHRIAARQIGEAYTSQVVFLIDEIESHLHPRWQRTILTSILKLMDTLHKGAKTQLVTATHSPLILSSAEPTFDAKRDAWFDLDLEGKSVVLRNRPFVRRGDVSNWLTSEAFDLEGTRSIEAEEAIRKAKSLLVRSPSPPANEFKKADSELRKVLGELDPFWVRWSAHLDRMGLSK